MVFCGPFKSTVRKYLKILITYSFLSFSHLKKPVFMAVLDLSEESVHRWLSTTQYILKNWCKWFYRPSILTDRRDRMLSGDGYYYLLVKWGTNLRKMWAWDFTKLGLEYLWRILPPPPYFSVGIILYLTYTINFLPSKYSDLVCIWRHMRHCCKVHTQFMLKWHWNDIWLRHRIDNIKRFWASHLTPDNWSFVKPDQPDYNYIFLTW